MILHCLAPIYLFALISEVPTSCCPFHTLLHSVTPKPTVPQALLLVISWHRWQALTLLSLQVLVPKPLGVS